MRTITLCAGTGSRLRPLTNNVPKTLVLFDGKPILKYQLDLYESMGLAENILVTGYMHNKITLGTTRIWNEKFASTNMVYSLSLVREFFDGTTDIILAYGDIIFEAGILQKLIHDPSEIAVVIDRNWQPYWSERSPDYLSDVESFEVDAQENIISIGQNWHDVNEIQGQYIGLMKFSKCAQKYIRNELESVYKDPEKHKMFMTDFLQMIINKGKVLRPVYIHSGWLEFDEVSDLDRKFKKFLK